MVDDVVSPFGYKRGEGIDAGFGEHDWICNRDRARTDPIFETLDPVDGKITGAGKNHFSFDIASRLHTTKCNRAPLFPCYFVFHINVIVCFCFFFLSFHSRVQRPRRN